MKKILLLSIMALMINIAFGQPQPTEFIKRPYLFFQNKTDQSTGEITPEIEKVVVQWQAPELIWMCYFQYGLASGSLGTAEGADEMTDLIFKYDLSLEDDLIAGEKYNYRVIVRTGPDPEDHFDAEGSFVAPPANDATNLRFYAYGDTRGGETTAPAYHDAVNEAILGQIDPENPSTQTLLIHSGDWNHDDSEAKWNQDYFNLDHENAIALKAILPVMGVKGNHEFAGTNYKKYWPYSYAENGSFFYSFDYGPVHFCILEIDSYDIINFPEQAQIEWLLETDLNNTDKKWKVLSFHVPGFASGPHPNFDYVQNTIQPICEEFGVQMVIVGHNHNYAHWMVNGVHHLTLGGGGGGLYSPNIDGALKDKRCYHFAQFDIENDMMDIILNYYDENEQVWKNDFDSFTLPHSLKICDGMEETWDEDITYADEIRVCSGSKLTINASVGFVEGGKIIIEPEGELVLDGGILTNVFENQTWQGIEVLGDPSSPFPSDQGLLTIKNGAIIENAQVAIRNHHLDEVYSQQGGIIKAYNSTFKNNIKTLDLRNYQYNSHIYIKDCLFEYDESYPVGGTPGYFVEINNMTGVNFLSCDFTNSTALNQVGKGIYSYNSQVSVKGKCVSAVEPCTEWENANFTNLEYGIYATAPSSTNYVDVRNVSFTNNYRGLYIGGITTPRVTSSEFFVIDDNNGYGLYLDESTGFWVEDNVFNGTGDKKGTGIIVNDVGPAANEIYLNEFNNLKFSINAQGKNRNYKYTDEGLVLKCNDYNETQFDETILWDLPFIDKAAGIAGDQGIDNLNIEDMAGNLFFINIGGFNDYDDINNEANQIDYYFSMNAGVLKVEPMDATWNTVDKYGKPTTLEWTYETACEPGINSGGGIEEERSKMDAAQSDIENTEAILAALVDGGDTEALNTEVETSTPPETVTVYNELMGKSPNLSETVVESTIGQETVLPNAMVRDVMVANPHTAKSQVLLDMLDERFDPMPDYMKAQILAGRSIQTLKQELESGLAGYKLQKAKAMNAIVSYYREELEDPADVSDSLLALFQADNTLNSAYRIAWLYLERDEYQQGLNVMGDIPSLFGLDEEGQQDYTNISGIYTMLSGLYQNGNTIESLSETELAGLQTLTVGDAGLARAYARNILIALGELEYDEPILQPDFLKSSMAIDAYNELLKAEAPQQLKAYPNPSKGYVILEYKIEAEAEGIIGIKDITGKTIKTIPTTEKQDQVTVLTENWQTGVYIANLTVNGKSIESVKFTIVK